MLAVSASKLANMIGVTAIRSARRSRRRYGPIAQHQRDGDGADCEHDCRAAGGRAARGRFGERVREPDHEYRDRHRGQREQRRQPGRRVIVVERQQEDEGGDAPGGVGDRAGAAARQHQDRQARPEHEQPHQRDTPEKEQRLVRAPRAERAHHRDRSVARVEGQTNIGASRGAQGRHAVGDRPAPAAPGARAARTARRRSRSGDREIGGPAARRPTRATRPRKASVGIDEQTGERSGRANEHGSMPATASTASPRRRDDRRQRRP